MLNSPSVISKTRAFDLIINLGVHAHLLEPPAPDGSTIIEEQYSQEAYFDNGPQVASNGIKSDIHKQIGNSSAIDKFECWILGILFEVLLHLVQVCPIYNWNDLQWLKISFCSLRLSLPVLYMLFLLGVGLFFGVLGVRCVGVVVCLI